MYRKESTGKGNEGDKYKKSLNNEGRNFTCDFLSVGVTLTCN
jgi:hypothetical protein